MAYTYKTKPAHKSNYYSATKRKLQSIQYLVFHYTGNDCDTDEANANYFTSPNRNASAHYFIDDDSVTCSVGDNYTAWSVGGGLQDKGSIYSSKGAKYYGKCTNANSISIELCDTTKDGKHTVSKRTRKNAIQFTAKKMLELDININHVIRHFDVTGKLCPIYFVTDEKDWEKFKQELQTELHRLNTNAKITANCRFYKEMNDWNGYYNSLIKGDKIKVINDIGNGWSAVSHNGTKGYIKNSCISRNNKKELSNYAIRKATHKVKYRSTRKIKKTTVLGELPKNTKFTLLGKDTNWVAAKYKGKRVYIWKAKTSVK